MLAEHAAPQGAEFTSGTSPSQSSKLQSMKVTEHELFVTTPLARYLCVAPGAGL